MSTLEETIERVAATEKEEFILARDKQHLNSLRVIAFYTRKKMPEQIRNDIGIKQVEEDGKFFLHIFPRGVTNLEHYARNKETGKLELLALPKESPELHRITDLMRKDGKTEEEITQFLKGEEKDEEQEGRKDEEKE